MKSALIKPDLWLIVLILGLGQLSETVYTPSLPSIAWALQTSSSMVEHTLTIYLFGFAIGTLFWGAMSDKLGRKPCIIMGLIIFIIGCFGCYFSTSIYILMISRFVQSFGGSIGSVLGQAVCRDVFHGPELGKVYSVIASSLAIFPALGPICGGLIAENLGWRNIFIFLILFTTILTILVFFRLPETHELSMRNSIAFRKTIPQLLKDKKVIGFGLIIGASNGITFSYCAEGPFCLINILGLSSSYYGLSFLPIAFASMLGGYFSKKLHAKYSSKQIMNFGLYNTAFFTFIFSLFVVVNYNCSIFCNNTVIGLIIFLYMGVALGVCMINSNALALALVNYKSAIGTASSLFGFFYYCVISLFTFFMGIIHSGTLLSMPLYFLFLSCFMMIVNHQLLKD